MTSSKKTHNYDVELIEQESPKHQTDNGKYSLGESANEEHEEEADEEQSLVDQVDKHSKEEIVPVTTKLTSELVLKQGKIAGSEKKITLPQNSSEAEPIKLLINAESSEKKDPIPSKQSDSTTQQKVAETKDITVNQNQEKPLKVKPLKVKKHKKIESVKEKLAEKVEDKQQIQGKASEAKNDKTEKKDEKKDPVQDDDDDIFAFNDSSSKQKYDVDKLEELKQIIFTKFEQDFQDSTSVFENYPVQQLIINSVQVCIEDNNKLIKRGILDLLLSYFK